jgi:hypothetical protein
MKDEDQVLLLEVEERFKLNDKGVVLAPDFPLPTGSGWKEYTFLVHVTCEDGSTSKFRAVASPIHLLVKDPAVERKGWRLTIVLPGAEKQHIPIKSKVYCSAKSYVHLFNQSPAQQGAPADAKKRRG